MRVVLSAGVSLFVLLVLNSCSGPETTRGDLMTFQLRDLNPWVGPRVVEVDPASLKDPDRNYVAQYRARPAADRRPVLPPVDFEPPQLPDHAGFFDGSLLPPKTEGVDPVIDVDGELPADPADQPAGLAPSDQELSIE